jgi:hypothetical protein
LSLSLILKRGILTEITHLKERDFTQIYQKWVNRPEQARLLQPFMAKHKHKHTVCDKGYKF